MSWKAQRHMRDREMKKNMERGTQVAFFLCFISSEYMRGLLSPPPSLSLSLPPLSVPLSHEIEDIRMIIDEG